MENAVVRGTVSSIPFPSVVAYTASKRLRAPRLRRKNQVQEPTKDCSSRPVADPLAKVHSVAATVADDAVIEVIRKVADLNPIDDLDKWIEHVERPAVSLHYETMAALSEGFGTGIVGVWVGRCHSASLCWPAPRLAWSPI